MAKKGLKAGFGGLWKNKFGDSKDAPVLSGKIGLDDDLIKAAKEDGALQLSAWKKTNDDGESYYSLAVQPVFKPKKNTKKVAKNETDDFEDDELDL